MLSYNESWQAFNELHNDMTSLCMKISSLTNEIDLLKIMDV